MENTELIGIWSRAREDIVNTLPTPLVENSKKGNKPIAFIGIDPDEAAPDNGVFDPTELQKGSTELWSEKRQAVSARRVIYTFLSYGLLTEKHDAHSGLADQGAGCGYFARDDVRDHMERIVRSNAAAAHETDANLTMLYALKTWNPLVADRSILTTGEFAPDFSKLLKDRLAGDTQLPWLCGVVIGGVVAGFPV
tara:strand:- start:228 stop:812 length:585 start_codon:yes stop_codon:yes gene_type:complete